MNALISRTLFENHFNTLSTPLFDVIRIHTNCTHLSLNRSYLDIEILLIINFNLEKCL